MTEAVATPPRGWFSTQILLGIAGVLTFLVVPIQINTVYEGLPAHPLFVHVPVILIPTVAAGGLILVAKPGWFERHSAWLCALTVFALAALNLTMSAGDALRNDLGLYGNSTAANLISRHAAAAGKLRVFMIFFTAAFIVAVALDRQSRGKTTGIGWIDSLVGSVFSVVRSLKPVRIVMGLLAVGCLYFVFLTGDLGARAVWAGRLPSNSGAPARSPAYGDVQPQGS
jgi:hypothetical protein